MFKVRQKSVFSTTVRLTLPGLKVPYCTPFFILGSDVLKNIYLRYKYNLFLQPLFQELC